MAPPIQLYFDFMSQPSRTVYLFLNLNGIPFEKCPIAVAESQQLGDAYRRINRFRKVPCIVDSDGFQVAEVTAILQYLCDSAPEHGRQPQIAGHWYPRDVRQRARVNEYLSWQHVNTRNTCTTYFRLCWMVPHLQGRTVSEARKREARDLMAQALDVIETVWLAGGEEQSWLVGSDEITIADLLAASELEQLSELNLLNEKLCNI